MAWEVREARDEHDVRRCWPVFRELRENITVEDDFVDRWKRQRDEGYRIVFIERAGEVQAVGGFRILHSMAWGRFLYLDDLAALTDQHGAGLGTAILRFVQDEARREGCAAVHLDTGYQRHRAHKAYLRNGFILNTHHLVWEVDGA
ncbi:GNAT family N-acetyltransferase [Micromonospora tarensis]|uniref:GNAT family N-acetyltransferase n=1 Tax=Micromonospora tarensis TaxID=2806100 RepID=A0ABS1YA72_9ACTN|nr:GNAT family N-acetyltransferase [Micromonospora tarensis]MBM0274294.1 GNAT family N-acetyltransferase [Micromonospora tarensis]